MASSAGILHEQEEAALAEYATVCRLAKAQLRGVWADLELSEEAVKAETEKIMLRAHEVWSEAVSHARELQQELSLQIEEAGREARSIQEELGQSAHSRRLSMPSQAESDMVPSEMTTHARLGRAKREVEYWRARKAERMEVVRRAQAEISRLRELLGKPVDANLASCIVDISDDCLEAMQAETVALQQEQAERASRLARALVALQAACGRVGEHYRPYAEAAHSSLSAFKFSVAEDGTAVAASADDEFSASVNLSDATFRALEKKMGAVEALMAERERHVQEITAKLEGLWQYLHMPEGDVDRELIAKLLSSGERLFPGTMATCEREYERLEVKKARKTCHTIRLKHEEFAKLAAEAHLEDSGVADMVQALQGGPSAAAGDDPMAFVRKVEETLARVQQNIEVMRAAGQKRAGALAKIGEIQGAVKEVEWLKMYEQDSNRFKGRDSGKNINRSIKAEKVRAGLPALLEGTIKALADWEDLEGEEFLYDGICYKGHLVGMKEEAEQILQAKGARGGAPRTAGSSRAAPGKAAAPPSSVTGTPTRGSSAATTARRTGISASAHKTAAVTPPQAAKKARPGATDENGHPDVIGNRGPATLRPASLTTTLAKNLMDLDVNSPTTETAAAAPKSFKRELQIDVNAENMEPPAKQATPTPTSDAPKVSSLRAPSKSMLKQPTSFRGH